jgi:hypothetical protein
MFGRKSLSIKLLNFLLIFFDRSLTSFAVVETFWSVNCKLRVMLISVNWEAEISVEHQSNLSIN